MPATLNISDPSNPVITVTLPAVADDVFGIEIRASDNTTVLYAASLSDVGFSPSFAVVNTGTALSYYVYTVNLLGEYSIGYNVTASAPTPGYTVSYLPTTAGVAFVVTPTGVLTDVNHYEVYWNFTGTSPASTQTPNWSGNINADGTFHFNIGQKPGTSVYAWVRAVGSSTLAQAWTALTTQAIKFIDPSSTDVLAKGNTPPVLNESFSYTATTTAITWSWTSMVIYRSDGTTTSPANGSRGNTGLNSSTAYYYYPYYDEAGAVVAWVNGSGHGSNGEAFIITQRTNANAQQQALQSRIALSNGPMSAATTSSGSGGGSGGGSGSCVRSHMLVHERTKGIIPAREVRVGDWIETNEGNGWTQVVMADERDQDLFIRVRVRGQYVEVTPTHPFIAMDENCNVIPLLEAGKLSCMHQLYTMDGADFVEAIELVKVPDGKKMFISCDEFHTFFSGETEPYILTHNLAPLC